MSNEAFRGSGLLARFLYSIPVSKVGSREYETTPIPPFIEAAFHGMLRELLEIPVPKNEEIITISTEAHQCASAFFAELEPRLKGDLESIGDWAGKLHGETMRIAGLLHVMEHRKNAANVPVSGSTMEGAIEIGRYFMEHAKATYHPMTIDPEIQNALYILQQLEKDKPEEIGRTGLNRLCHGRFDKAEDMDPAIRLLEEHRYIKTVEMDTGYNNRKKTLYKINPTVWEEKCG